MDFNFKVFAVDPGNCCACRLVLGEAEPLSGSSNCSQWALHQGGPYCEQFAQVTISFMSGVLFVPIPISMKLKYRITELGSNGAMGPLPTNVPWFSQSHMALSEILLERCF